MVVLLSWWISVAVYYSNHELLWGSAVALLGIIISQHCRLTLKLSFHDRVVDYHYTATLLSSVKLEAPASFLSKLCASVYVVISHVVFDLFLQKAHFLYHNRGVRCRLNEVWVCVRCVRRHQWLPCPWSCDLGSVWTTSQWPCSLSHQNLGLLQIRLK